jgi:calcium/calmodulin-dependent protein kinase (CaM kinase) II
MNYLADLLGLSFHKYYFDLPDEQGKPPTKSSISSPHVILTSEVVVICYIRVKQAGVESQTTCETRVWQLAPLAGEEEPRWRLVHLHRT